MAIFRVIFRSSGYFNLWRLSPKNSLKRVLGCFQNLKCNNFGRPVGATGLRGQRSAGNLGPLRAPLSVPFSSELCALLPLVVLPLELPSEKTKGNKLKGKIVRHFFTLFGTLPHIFTLFESFLQDFFLESRGFTTVLAQRDENIIKDNKKKKAKPFCTLVVALLSSSNSYNF